MLFINTKTNRSFTFEPYEHNLIYGPNGSYKSMFLKYLAQVVTQHPFGVISDPNATSDLVETYSIKTILKNRALDGLKSYKKNALFYMDNNRIELVPTKADLKSDEDMVLSIYFSESYCN